MVTRANVTGLMPCGELGSKAPSAAEKKKRNWGTLPALKRNKLQLTQAYR
jgi:hypothetical protein